jgi:hypothetical protein
MLKGCEEEHQPFGSTARIRRKPERFSPNHVDSGRHLNQRQKQYDSSTTPTCILGSALGERSDLICHAPSYHVAMADDPPDGRTSMSDEPFYAPNRKIALRQPRVGEHLWAVRKDGRQLDCELRDHGEWGVEVQVYREREFLYGRRWATRALALEEADEQKTRCLREGGVFIA